MGHGGLRPGSEGSLENTDTAWLSWNCGCQLLKDLGAGALPSYQSTWIIHPDTMLTGKERLVQFLFFLSSTFCLSIDSADGNLVSQLPSVPIWSEYIWKDIIWIHLFFKNESENRHGVGEAFYLFFFFVCPINIVSKTNKQTTLSQQGLLLLHSSYLKINLIYKDWEGYSDILQCK